VGGMAAAQLSTTTFRGVDQKARTKKQYDSACGERTTLGGWGGRRINYFEDLGSEVGGAFEQLKGATGGSNRVPSLGLLT